MKLYFEYPQRIQINIPAYLLYTKSTFLFISSGGKSSRVNASIISIFLFLYSHFQNCSKA